MMEDKIVIQFGHRSIKGRSDRSLWKYDSSFQLTSLPVQIDGGGEEWVSSTELKAIFFVKSFEGQSHDDLRFHDHSPHAECLWVRVTFKDDEVMEGLIHNRSDFVLDAGFFFFPIDPEGNNWLVYVPKIQVKAFHILGLRPAPRNLPDMSRVLPSLPAE